MEGRLLPILLACLCAVLSAVGIVLVRRMVRCTLLLLVHSLSIAMLYLLLDADFVAMGQITVYSGAIVVLFLFVVLLLPSGGEERPLERGRLLLVAMVGAAVLIPFAIAFAGVQTDPLAVAPTDAGFGVKKLAHVLFGPLLVPFEVTAVLLLVAIVGGVALWQREDRGGAA